MLYLETRVVRRHLKNPISVGKAWWSSLYKQFYIIIIIITDTEKIPIVPFNFGL